MSEDRVNTNAAPYPEALERLVEACSYREGWLFYMRDEDRGQGSRGLTLTIVIDGFDTYNPTERMRVRHLFPVPPAAYNEQSWRRWLFDRVLKVERHEAAEFFQIDGKRPYAPHHGPGCDPYLIFEVGTTQEQRTNFLGEERGQDAPLEGKF